MRCVELLVRSAGTYLSELVRGAGTYLSEGHASQGVPVGPLLILVLGLQEGEALAGVRIHVSPVSLHSTNANGSTQVPAAVLLPQSTEKVPATRAVSQAHMASS